MSKGEEDRVEKELVALVTERLDASGINDELSDRMHPVATPNESAKSLFGETVDRMLAASGLE